MLPLSTLCIWMLRLSTSKRDKKGAEAPGTFPTPDASANFKPHFTSQKNRRPLRRKSGPPFRLLIDRVLRGRTSTEKLEASQLMVVLPF
jgi:hypothetical protein